MSEKTIVVCDDEELVYFAVQMIMEKMGYRVLEANTGEKAIQLAKKHLPVVMFQDIEMPGMNGFEVCRRIKAEPATAHIPIIFVSATDFKKNLDQILDSGGEYFVPKPFEPEDLAVDLYFLAEADFKPQPHTLSQLRIARSLELERARRSPKEGKKTPEAVAGEKPTEEEAPTEISGEISVTSFNNLQRLVVVLSERLDALEDLLVLRRILPEHEIKQVKARKPIQPIGTPREKEPKESPKPDD